MSGCIIYVQDPIYTPAIFRLYCIRHPGGRNCFEVYDMREVEVRKYNVMYSLSVKNFSKLALDQVNYAP